MPEPTLVTKMLTYANDHSELPWDTRERLWQAADDLDDAIIGEPEWSARRLLGAWARARLLWQEVTGEPLV